MKKILLLICIFSLYLCCSPHKKEWQGTIEEVDGVTVVKNPKEPLYIGDVLELEEDLTIGEKAGIIDSPLEAPNPETLASLD